MGFQNHKDIFFPKAKKIRDLQHQLHFCPRDGASDVVGTVLCYFFKVQVYIFCTFVQSMFKSTKTLSKTKKGVCPKI